MFVACLRIFNFTFFFLFCVLFDMSKIQYCGTVGATHFSPFDAHFSLVVMRWNCVTETKMKFSFNKSLHWIGMVRGKKLEHVENETRRSKTEIIQLNLMDDAQLEDFFVCCNKSNSHLFTHRCRLHPHIYLSSRERERLWWDIIYRTLPWLINNFLWITSCEATQFLKLTFFFSSSEMSQFHRCIVNILWGLKYILEFSIFILTRKLEWKENVLKREGEAVKKKCVKWDVTANTTHDG